VRLTRIVDRDWKSSALWRRPRECFNGSGPAMLALATERTRYAGEEDPTEGVESC